MVALGASVALSAGDPVLAGTLPVGLAADLAQGTHRVAVARLARLPVGDFPLAVAEVSLLQSVVHGLNLAAFFLP